MAATEDMFTPIHKGLRSMLYHLSGQLQVHDFADVDATQKLLAQLEHDFAVARSAGCALCVMRQHAEDEESVIFPSVSPSANGLVGQLVREHFELTRREGALAEAGRRIVALESPTDRVAAGVRLNADANELLSAYLTHMNREDTELVPLLQQQLTNEQMIAMRGRIMAGMPPDRLLAILGWMLPSLNVTELSRLIGDARKGAPPALVRAVTDLCAARVDPARWAEVQHRLGA